VRVYDACGTEVDGSGKGRKFYAFACPNGQNIPKNGVKNVLAGGFRQLMAQKGIIRMIGNEVVILDTKGYQYWREVEAKIR